jgi:hypothetical protein
MSLRVLVSLVLVIVLVLVFVALVVVWKELKSPGTRGRKRPPPS